MLYEGLKENATIVLVPSSAIDSMQLGSLAGTTALAMKLDDRHKKNAKRPEKIEKKKAIQCWRYLHHLLFQDGTSTLGRK